MCEPIRNMEISFNKNNIYPTQRLFLIYTHVPVLERGGREPALILILFYFIKTHLITDYKVMIPMISAFSKH